MDDKEHSWDDMNLPKLTILPWVIWASIVGAVILYLGFSLPARAEEVPVHVHEQDGLSIRLMSGPCVDANSLAFMGGHYTERLRAIESTWRMRDGSTKTFAGCWMLLTKEEAGAESFFLIFEDGERHLIPKNDFLKKRGQVGA